MKKKHKNLLKGKWDSLSVEEKTPYEKKSRDHTARQGVIKESIVDALQKKNGEEWIDLKVHRGTKNVAGCKGDFPFSFETSIRGLGEGVHTLRWKRADNRKFSTSTKSYEEFQVTIIGEATK